MARKVNYHECSFWEERYKQNVCEWFQWLAPPNQFNAVLKEKIIPNSNILELGCGSSNLAEKLTTLGHEVTCLDFSKELIKSRSKSNSNSKITYKLHNIQEKLPFEDGSFDLIIEKNTLDCLFCQENFVPTVLRSMKECFRVLKPNGRMISITHGKEKNRKFFYRNRFCPFNVEVHPLQNKKSGQAQVLIFVLNKGGEAIKEDQEHSEEDNNYGENSDNEHQQRAENKKEKEKKEEEEEEHSDNQEEKEAGQKSKSETEHEQKQQDQHQKQKKQQKEEGEQQEQEQQYQFDQLNPDEQDQ